MSFIHVQPIIKKSKKMVLYLDQRGNQWVGDSCSAYRLYDIPVRVDHNNLFDMMGLDDTQRKKYSTFEHMLPSVSLGDYSEKVDWLVPFVRYGDLYQVIRSGNKTICVLNHYLTPLRSLDQKEYRIEKVNGINYLIVSVGALDLAVIAGEPIGTELVSDLQYTVDSLEDIAIKKEESLFDRNTGEAIIHEQ